MQTPRFPQIVWMTDNDTYMEFAALVDDSDPFNEDGTAVGVYKLVEVKVLRRDARLEAKKK